ncbi:SAM-dependent methyltransferase [Bradyrhizobium sp. i1.3.1]
MASEAINIRAAVGYYEGNSAVLLDRYESVTFPLVHPDLVGLVRARPGRALDIGCGSGRDAAFLAKNGWDVVAVDTSSAMLQGARRLHPDKRIRWLHDGLPLLPTVKALDSQFDLVLASAVWMHVPPSEQRLAVATVAGLLSSGGSLSITLRKGKAEKQRGFFETDSETLRGLFAVAGVHLTGDEMDPDRLGRADISWTKLLFRKSG